jgi:hypothetical protein
MSIFKLAKDGGPNSKVFGFWIIEWKSVFSIAILMFEQGSRECYHSHAFDAISWLLSGGLKEVTIDGEVVVYGPSFSPIITKKSRTHKVYGLSSKNWVLTFRGPWNKTWTEIDENGAKRLTNHRVEVNV